MQKITPFLWFNSQAEEAMMKMGKIDIQKLQDAAASL